jgi:hypothetical protein
MMPDTNKSLFDYSDDALRRIYGTTPAEFNQSIQEVVTIGSNPPDPTNWFEKLIATPEATLQQALDNLCVADTMIWAISAEGELKIETVLLRDEPTATDPAQG